MKSKLPTKSDSIPPIGALSDKIGSLVERKSLTLDHLVKKENPFILLLWAFLSLPLPLMAQTSPGALDNPQPFLPTWSGHLEIGYVSMEGGQEGAWFSLRGDERLSRSGSYFFAGVLGGTHQLEGSKDAYEGFAAGGGVGLGGWIPRVSLSVLTGDNSYNSMIIQVGAEVPLSQPLLLDLNLNGEVTSHNGPLASLIGTSDSSDEVDNLNASLVALFRYSVDPSVTILLGARQDMNETVKVQNLSHTVSQDLNLMNTLDTLKAGLDFHFWKTWTVELTGEEGWDSLPAGSFYSDRLAQTLTTPAASTRSFTDASASLVCDF